MLKLSITVPTYNKANYLCRLLDSLLTQDFPQQDFEVIVVNDGSTDHTATVIENYRPLFMHFQVITQENKGIGAARNAGIRAAAGELIAFVADDYELAEDYCSCLVPAFENEDIIGIRGDLGSVGSSAIEKAWLHRARIALWHGLHGHQTAMPRKGRFRLDLNLPAQITPFKETMSWSGGSMMRRWIFECYGLFREDLPTGEDSEMGKRLAAEGILPHFYPKRLVSVAFRSGYVESLKRLHQYSSNGRLIKQIGYSRPKAQQSLWRRINNFAGGTVKILRLADRKTDVIKMLPYVLSTRLIVLWVHFRG